MDATVEPATTDGQVRAAARLFRQMLDECAGSYAADEPPTGRHDARAHDARDGRGGRPDARGDLRGLALRVFAPA